MSAHHYKARMPNTGRRGLLTEPRTMLLALLALLFSAYALGYLPQLDGILAVATERSRSQGLWIAGPIILLIVGLFVLFVLVLILGALFKFVNSVARKASFLGRKAITLQQFTKLAQLQGLSPRVAIETYHLLKPHYPGRMCIEFEDELRKHLILKDENILYLQSRLLNRCGRREVLSFSVEAIQTVFDLMQHAEGAAPQHLSGTVLRRPSVDLNPDAVEDRRFREDQRAVGERRSAAGSAFSGLDRRGSQVRRAGERRKSGEAGVSGAGVGELGTDSGMIRRRDSLIAPMQTAPPETLGRADAAEGTDPNFLPPRRREQSGMYRRAGDMPVFTGESATGTTPQVDDTGSLARSRTEYSGVRRRASELGGEGPAPADIEPTRMQIAAQTVGRRFGDTGFRPRGTSSLPPAAPAPDGISETEWVGAPRRISDTGFRRRNADLPGFPASSDEPESSGP